MSRITSPAASQSPTTSGPAIPHEKIAKRAYEKWCMRGCMDGCAQQDWLEAEAELRSEMGGKVMQTPPPAPRAQAPAPAATTQKSASRR
jgi:hypothetical protein